MVVSTVGNMRELKPQGNVQTIGHERYYETMAFHARWEEPYWEADVHFEIFPDGLKWSIGQITHETDFEADAMHEAYVSGVKERMLNGEIKELTFEERQEDE